jgi:DNA-binding CsgD family transcriptional regulator
LSPLQLRVLKLTAEGKTLKESSQLLNIKERKVDAVRSQLKKKFGVKTTPELIARAIHLGLVDSGELTRPNQLVLFQEE